MQIPQMIRLADDLTAARTGARHLIDALILHDQGGAAAPVVSCLGRAEIAELRSVAGALRSAAGNPLPSWAADNWLRSGASADALDGVAKLYENIHGSELVNARGLGDHLIWISDLAQRDVAEINQLIVDGVRVVAHA